MYSLYAYLVQGIYEQLGYRYLPCPGVRDCCCEATAAVIFLGSGVEGIHYSPHR